MSITLPDLEFLTSDAGTRALQRLADQDLADNHILRLITSLRRDLTPEQASAALELARLRRKAAAKFGDDAAKMYFTREALEQASDPLVRQWRAQENADAQTVVDACCGIGADSLAFARAGCDVFGLDMDSVRVAMARLNAEALGVPAHFEIADVREGVPNADLIFFDPGRRDENGKRLFDVERYQPPLSTVRSWQAQRILVKLSPGVESQQLEPYSGMVSFVSVFGELKEATLCMDPQAAGRTYRAVLFGHGEVARAPAYWSRDAEEVTASAVGEPRGWLVEPDAAIIRAGLVADLALELGGVQLDPEIAYLTTEVKPVSPWVRAWKIIDWMPFNVKKLRAYLRERNVGTVTVKKRGTAVTPEALIAHLKLNGNGSRTIVLTRCRGEHVTVVCEDLTIEGGG